MKVGIVIYSETGNTLLVAKLLKDSIKNADILLVKASGLTKNDRMNFKIEEYPDIKGYDVLIFGSFVEAFRLTPVMREYIKTLKLSNKKVMLFLTHFFPFNFMGASGSIKQMKNICQEKGANVLATAIIDWKNSNRDKQIIDLINKFKGFID